MGEELERFPGISDHASREAGQRLLVVKSWPNPTLRAPSVSN